MNCALTQEQFDSLLKKVDKDLRTMMESNAPFNFADYTRSIHDRVLSKMNDPALALAYAQLIPANILKIVPFNADLRKYIRTGITLDQLDDLVEDFRDIDSVSRFLGLGAGVVQELEQIVTEENLDNLNPAEPAEETATQQERQIRKTGGWNAKPSSGLTTTGQEGKTVDGKYTNIPDPGKVFHYNVARKVLYDLTTQGKMTAAEVGPGFKITAMAASTIPFEQLYPDTQEWLRTKGQEAQDKHNAGVVLVITDNSGNPYYFNERYEPSGPTDGKMAYLMMRSPSLQGDKYVLGAKDIQTAEEIAANLNIPVEQAEEIRQRELKQNYDIRQYILADPQNNKVVLDITGGSYGYVDTPYKIGDQIGSVPLSNINFQGRSFSFHTATIDTPTEQEGATYLSVEGVDRLIKLDRPKIGPDLAAKLARLLVGPLYKMDAVTGEKRPVSAPERKEIFEHYAFSNSKKLYVVLGNNLQGLTVKINGNFINMTNADEARAKIADYLSNQYININANSLKTGYTDFTISDDQITTEFKSYKDYIMQKAGAFVSLNENNEIVQLNGYLTYSLPADQRAKLYPEAKPQIPQEKSVVSNATPTDKPVEGKSARDRFKELYRSNKLSSDVSEEQITAAKQWYENSPLAKHLPFRELFNIVNSDAFASWTVNGITLYKGANYTDLYHEAWHGFSQMFLTREDKAALYNEVRNLKGSMKLPSGTKIPFSLASDLQLEEFLAEDFRAYAISGGKKTLKERRTRNNIFRRIWDFLNSLFSGTLVNDIATQKQAVQKVKDLYDKLYVGNINEYTPSLNNVQFGVLNKGIERIGAEGGPESLSYEDSRLVVDTIDSLISKLIDISNAETGSHRFTSMLFRNPVGLRIAYDFVMNDPEFGLIKLRADAERALADAKDDLDVQRGEAKVNLLNFVINNFGDIESSVTGKEDKGVIAYHRLKSKYLDFDARIADLEQGTDNETFEKGLRGWDRNGNELSVKELASNETLYLIRGLHKMKNGKPVVNKLGVPELTDFDRVWNRLVKTLESSLSPQDMYKRLVNEQETFPEFKQLLSKLGPPADHKDMASFDMWTKFFQDFCLTRIPLIQMNLNKATEYSEESPDVKSEKYDITLGQVAANFRQVPRRFYQEFATSPRTKYIGRDDRGAYLNVDAVLAEFKTTKGREFEFFHAIGFPMADTPEIRQALSEGIGSPGFIRKTLETLHQKGIQIRNPFKQIADGYPDLGLKGEAGNLNKLYELQARYSDEYSNYSVTNAENNPQNEHSLNNTVTLIVNTINSVRTYDELINIPYMSWLDIRNNPFAKSSVWLNSIFDLDPASGTFGQKRKDGQTDVTLRLENLSGVQVITDSLFADDGVATSRSDEFTKLLTDFHALILRGSPELMRHASKSTAYTVTTTSLLTKDSKTKFLYVDTSKFLPEFNGRGFELARDIIFNYIGAELERVKIVRTGQYDNIPGFSQRGKEFTVFSDILSDNVKNELYALDRPFQEFLKSTAAGDIELKRKMNNELRDYFTELTKRTEELLERAEYIDESVYDSIRKELERGQASRITRESLRQAAIASFTYNSWIHNFESLNMLYGDLALYNTNKEEFHKRNAGIASTGYRFRTDTEAQKFINTIAGRTYAKANNMPVKEFNGTFDAAVLEDTNVPSTYLNDYEADFRKYYEDRGLKGDALERAVNNAISPYKKMTEGDAQGWITFDSYRILLMIEGKWSPKQEVLYQKIANGESVSARDVSLFFPPKKAQYFGPLANTKLHTQAMHKFSLLPLIPSVVKGTNLENLHNMMVKQGVDYALYESGSKVATITTNGSPDKIYKDKKTRALADTQFTKNTVYLEFLKDQLDIDASFKGKVIFATQFRKLVEEGLYENGKPLKPEFEKLVKAYERNVQRLSELKKTELIKEAGWEQDKNGNPIPGDMKAILSIVRKELMRQDLADHEIDFIDVNSDGTLKFDLSMSLSAERIERLLTAIVNRRLVRQKVNGEGLIQASGSLFENLSAYEPGRDFTNPTYEELQKYGTNDLPSYRNDGGKTKAAKVKIALQGQFVALLNLTHKDGNKVRSLSRLNEMLKDEQWLDQGDHRRMITLIGTRIPVQGLNSMEFMEVYEFLPQEAGNILVPPSEIVAKSGSDFDIDKLNVMMPNLKVSRKTGEVKLYTQVSEQEARKMYDDLKAKKLDKALRRTSDGQVIPEGAISPEEQAAIDKLLGAIFGNQFSMELSEEEINDILSEEGLDSFEAFFAKLNGTKAVENDILADMRAILELPENFVSLIRPNDVDLVKGVADELAPVVQEYNPKLSTRKDQSGNFVKTATTSATRVLEPAYNIYKHASNNGGKQVLGQFAKGNTYNTIFNRIGAHMEPFASSIGVKAYDELKKKDPKKLTADDKRDLASYRRLTLLLDHNTMDYMGHKVISLSNLYDVEGKNKIADIISQLINGAVDVEKDAWIFNVQGNTEVAPVLEFLVEAGVPFRTAVYFVSQPLILEYVKQQRLARSTFAGPLGVAPKNKNFYRSKAKDIILTDPKYGFGFKPKQTFGKGLYDKTVELTNKVGKEAFQLSSLETNIKMRDNDVAKAVFLHYLEIEDMAADIQKIKRATDFDTRKSSTLFDAQNRITLLEELKESERVPAQVIDAIMNESVIGNFFIQDFQLKIWSNMFKLRSHEVLNNFISRKLKTASKGSVDETGEAIPSDIESTFGKPDKFAEELRNDLMSFIFQNALKSYNPLDMKTYKGMSTAAGVDIKPATIKRGAFVKDGVMYIDRAQLQRDWDARIFNTNTYDEMGLARVPEKAFMTKTSDSKEEFFRYVVEREYLRSIIPFKDYSATADYKERFTQLKFRLTQDESQEDFNKRVSRLAYEEMLRDKALDNIFNYWKLFYSPTSVANTFIKIRNRYPYLRQDYSLVNSLSVAEGKGGILNIKLNDRILDSDKVNTYHENLLQLSDPNQLNIPNAEERNEVAQFFARIPIIAFLQSGISKGEMSITRIVPTDTFTRIMEQPVKEYVEKINDDILEVFYKRFVTENSDKKTRNRLKDYTTHVTLDSAGKSLEDMQKAMEQLQPGKRDSIFTLPPSFASGEDYLRIAAISPEKVFVYNENNRATGDETTDSALRKADNGMPLLTKLQPGRSTSSFMSDDRYDDNIKLIEESIQKIADLYNTGREVVFLDEGYGREMIRTAPRTFVYLSKRLFEEFGYVNPGSDKSKTVRQLIQSQQPVTDEMIEEFINKCFS